MTRVSIQIGPHTRAIALSCLLAAAGLASSCNDEESRTGDDRIEASQHALTTGFGAVHGYVDARITANVPAFALPDATVRLKRTTTGVLTSPVTTDVKGLFIASDVPVGTYVICASASGFFDACTSKTFQVKSRRIANPAHAVLDVQRFAVYGRVTLSDQQDVRYENALFNTEVDTFVRALTPAGALVAGPVRANVRGQYVIGKLTNASYRIAAQSETSVIESLATVSSVPLKRDMALPNRRPAIAEVNVMQAGKTVRHVSAGAKVQLNARASDPDGHALRYRWLAPGGSCPNTNAASVECTMPSQLGTQSIFVQITDSIGQYSVGRVRLSVGPATALFSGRLIDDGGAAVPGAEVKVNGVVVSSNGTGGFSLTVAEANRYVLTIRKDGYQMISKAFLAERTGATYRMLAAAKQTIDPRIDNTIVVRPPKGRSSGFKDITVKLKANTIVGANGALITTPVDVYHSRFDHLFDTFDRMPGDYGAIDKNGKDVTLTSFGALEMNLRGPGGAKYNLAPGATADLTYPVHASQAAAAQAQLPLWYYNEDKGLWEEDGVATLVSGEYLAKAKHFSAINVDLAKTNATCVKLVVDQTTLSVPFKIRLSVPGSPSRDRDVTENVQAIVRLPPNVPNSKIVVLDDTDTPILNSERTFTTGDAIAAGLNLDLPAPYNDCITPPSPPVTLGLDLPQGPSPTYLTYLSNPGDDQTYATAYYTAIAADATLNAWKLRNGFGADEADAYYFNAGDLEFGRSMHMRRRADGGIAYYVTNFADADKAYAGAAADVIATVAMEYSSYPSPVVGAPRFTKFYVFNNLGNRVDKAELDNRGDKFVPALCVICHGGTLPADIAAAGGNVEARFIPFDLKSFSYPALLDRSAQEEDFRELNEGLYVSTNPTEAQQELIDSWYPGGVATAGQQQLDDVGHIPFNWRSGAGVTAADSTFYYDVLRPSCRACHTSRSFDSGLDFGSKPVFESAAPTVKFAVCDAGFMPQAFVTWRNFWHSTTPAQPNSLGAYLFALGASPDSTCAGP